MSRKVFMSFLGTGRYDACRYTKGKNRSMRPAQETLCRRSLFPKSPRISHDSENDGVTLLGFATLSFVE